MSPKSSTGRTPIVDERDRRVQIAEARAAQAEAAAEAAAAATVAALQVKGHPNTFCRLAHPLVTLFLS